MAPRSTLRRYTALCFRLCEAFPQQGAGGGFDQIAAAIITAMRGAGYDAWQMFDEQSGYRDVEPWRFALVRQVRNSPLYGPMLLQAAYEPERLTITYVRDQLRGLGVTIRRTEGGDFRVRLLTAGSGEGYFTTDLRDALDTGRQMASHDMRATADYLDGAAVQ